MKNFLILFSFLIVSCKISFSQAVPVQYLDPIPGAKYVNKETGIIIKPFFKPSKAIIGDNNIISVTGSKSGVHKGDLVLSSDGEVIIFKPYNKFVLSDTVFVKLSSRLTNNSTPFNYYFVIKQKEPTQVGLSSLELELDRYFSQNQPLFKSYNMNGDSLPSDFPLISIDTSISSSTGYIFLDNFTGSYPSYLMILDNFGVPVFYRKMTNTCIDFKVQPNGYLTYFSYNANKFYELNGYYQIIDSFYTGNNYVTDAHELRVLNNGSAYLMSYDPQVVDMSKIVSGGDPGAIVTGLIVQQIDSNKNVIFQWRSWDHFLITDATHENLLAHNIDYVHGNAIEVDFDGNIMISSRHLDEITKINRSNGNIIWRLGGKNNQFTFYNDPVGFSHQHFIRRLSNGNITLFDNGNYHSPPFSRAVEYTLNEQSKTATLVWQYRNSPDIYGSSMGSAQRLDNGNTLICWGSTNPTVTEVTDVNSIVFQLTFSPGVIGYRGYRMDWSPTAPALKFPVNGETQASLTPKLFWFKMPNAIDYRVQIAADSGFNNIILDTNNVLLTQFVIPPGKLSIKSKYYWRVNSQSNSGTTPWSLIWNFTTIAPLPSAPILISPANNSTGIPLTPVMDWNDVTYAFSYRLQISLNSLFGTTLWDTTGVTVSQVILPAGKLSGLTKYYWRINATNSVGTGPWSAVWNFSTLQNLSVNMKLYLEGFWNGSQQVADTVRVYLVNSTAPYAFVDSSTVILSSLGTAEPVFTKAANGSYYLVIKHRNHLETWSTLPQQFTSETPLNYDFTTDANKAFGNNMKQVGGAWVFFGGDPNQDGEISALDIPIFIAEFGLTGGYFSCDFNGDGDVNAMDVQIIAANFGLTKAIPTLDYNGNKGKKEIRGISK